MRFFVGTELLVGGSIQMNGQVGDSQDGAIDVDEFVMQFAVGRFDENATGDFQVTIEPRVPNATAVTFHAHLPAECLVEDIVK